MNATDALRREAAIEAAIAANDLDQAASLATDYVREAGEFDGTDPQPSLPFRARHFLGQVQLRAGQLRQTLKALDPLVGTTGLSLELDTRLRLAVAEAHVRLGDHAQAVLALQGVPATLLVSLPLLRLRALRVRLRLGEVRHLSDELSTCAAALDTAGEAVNHALLLCDEGCAWDREGDLARAQVCWEQAERLTQPLPADPIRADVLLQLGRLEHLRGHLASSLDRYEAAQALAVGGQQLEVKLRQLLVRLDLGQEEPVRREAQRLLGDHPLDRLPEEVLPLAGMVRGLLDGTPPPDASPELRAVLALQQGQAEEARSLFIEALAASNSPERRARLVLSLGLLALGHGAPHEARSWLHEAEELARSRDLPQVLARAVQASGQIAAEQEGNEDLARKLFEEAVLITEVQAGLFRRAVHRATHRGQRSSVLRHLLRAACRRGDAAAVFRYQELERGRLLLDLLQSSGAAHIPLFQREEVRERHAELARIDGELAGEANGAQEGRRRALLGRREELLLRRDCDFEAFLHERGRAADTVLPAQPTLDDLRHRLPPGTLYVAPALIDEEVFLLAATREGAEVVRGGRTARLREQLEGWRHCVTNQMARYRYGWLNRSDRQKLDERLEEFGRTPLGDALFKVLRARPTRPRRLLWVPDVPLGRLPIHAVRRDGRYLVQDVDVVEGPSGAWLVHQARTRRRRGFFRPALVVTESPKVLPHAEPEGRAVAAAFWRSLHLTGAQADRKTVRAGLARAQIAHFACHADFDEARPLAACLHLPSGEPIHALEWLDEPVASLPLVTLSACRSAEVAPMLGQEVFGLVTGLLVGGVRAVLAGLWPVADLQALPLMTRFYRHRLTTDLAAALALAQREALAAPDSSPLFWAAFALYGDADALPAPGLVGRWLGRLRQRRHDRRFPLCSEE
jgi:tetratricopeptide (TPR) repeat protein